MTVVMLAALVALRKAAAPTCASQFRSLVWTTLPSGCRFHAARCRRCLGHDIPG